MAGFRQRWNGYSPAGPGRARQVVPSYSSHGIGVQSNFILPKKDLVAFFKYYDAYKALASVKGRTFVFGFSWTLKIPKTQAP